MNCRKCYSENADHQWHEGRQTYLTRCNECNAVTWQPLEKNEDKRHSKHFNLVKKKGLEYCEWCLRKRLEIPAPGTLEGHHIIEYKDGGSDDISNILVLCSSCHKLCHHSRTYYGHYKSPDA